MTEHFLNYPTRQEAQQVANSLNAAFEINFMQCNKFRYYVGPAIFAADIELPPDSDKWAGVYRTPRLGAPGSPAKASSPAPAPIASPEPETPGSAQGEARAIPSCTCARCCDAQDAHRRECRAKADKLRLPPEPKGKIKFQVRSVAGKKFYDGRILGYIYADNVSEAAVILGGKLVNSSPGWGYVELPDERPVELRW